MSPESDTCSVEAWTMRRRSHAAMSSAGATSARACRRRRCPRTRTAPCLGAGVLASWSSASGACTATCVDTNVINHVVAASTLPHVLDCFIIYGAALTGAAHVCSHQPHRAAASPSPTLAFVIASTSLMVTLVPRSAVLLRLVLARSWPAAPLGVGVYAPLCLHCSALARLRTGRTHRLMKWPSIVVAMAINAPSMWR